MRVKTSFNFEESTLSRDGVVSIFIGNFILFYLDLDTICFRLLRTPANHRPTLERVRCQPEGSDPRQRSRIYIAVDPLSFLTSLQTSKQICLREQLVHLRHTFRFSSTLRKSSVEKHDYPHIPYITFQEYCLDIEIKFLANKCPKFF